MPGPPACPGPPAEIRGASRFTVPPGAVDTHGHVIGLPPDYPFVTGRSYTPPEATPASYLRMLDTIGMSYGVLVQVSVHGTDNRLMLDTLRANPGRLRGVGVIPLGMPPGDLMAMREAGVRGLRVNLVYGGGGIGAGRLQEYGALCRDMGWHLQFLADARQLPELAPALARLPVPLVLDNMGHSPAAAGIAEPGFQTLLSLLRDGAWVKLSEAYRLAQPPYAETIPIAQALLNAAPSRCIWGSGWPHVANWEHMTGAGELLDLLADWAPDEAARHAVLVDNPARLYGFGS